MNIMTKSFSKGLRMSDNMVGVVLVLPALAIFCAIILYPFINSVFMSFTNRSLTNPNIN